MGGTTRSTLISGSVLAVEKDEDEDEDEANGEVGGAGGGVLALWMGWTIGSFFFLAGGRTVELEDGRYVVEACLNISSWRFFLPLL